MTDKCDYSEGRGLLLKKYIIGFLNKQWVFTWQQVYISSLNAFVLNVSYTSDFHLGAVGLNTITKGLIQERM